MTHHTNRELEILQDPSASYWVKERMMELSKRDPVQSINELELLLELQQERLSKVMPDSSTAQ